MRQYNNISAFDVFVYFNNKFFEQKSIRINVKLDLIEINVLETKKELFFDDRLALAARRRSELKKQIQLQQIIANNAVLKSCFKLTETLLSRELATNKFVNKFDDDSENDNASILTNASLMFRRRIIKFKKISLYHEKITKKHIDYKQNCFTTFRLTSKDYSSNFYKIVYVMQYLIDMSKNN